MLSDLGISSAYFVFSVLLLWFVHKQFSSSLLKLFYLVAILILVDGATHLLNALISIWPVYPFYQTASILTAVIAWLSVFTLMSWVYKKSNLKTASEHEQLILELEAKSHALAESEQRYRLAVEGLKNYALFTLDNQGHITSWNSGAERIFGYQTEEIMGQSFARLFVQEERIQDKPESELKIAQSIGRFEGQGLRQRKEGTRFWASVVLTALYENEQMIGYSKTVQDITERKQAEVALLDEEAKSRAIVTTAIDGIVTIDENARIVFFNQAAESMFGYTATEVMGRNVNLLMPSPYHEEHDSYLGNYLTTGIKKIIGIGREVIARRKDGSIFPIDLSLSEVQLAQRRLFTGIIRDVTERKQAEIALLDSESRMRAVLETTVDAIITIDERGGILSFNQAATRLFGYRPDEVMGQNVNMLMPSPYHEEHDVYLGNYLTTGLKKIIGIGREVLGQRKDGSKFPLELAVSEVLLKDSRIFTGIIRDLTERKTAEARKLAILEASLDAIITVNQAGQVFEWNTAAEVIFGYKRQAVLEHSILELIIPERDRQTYLESLSHYLKTGDEHILGKCLQLTVMGAEGIEFPAEVVITRIQGDIPILFAATIRDITERKHAEAEILSLNASLEQRVIERTTQLEVVNKELEAFSYSVSHDLRAPLRGIDGFSQILMEHYSDKLDEKGQHYLNRVRQGSQQMGKLIDDMLQLSRLTRGQIRIETIDLSLEAKVIAQELQTYEPTREVIFAIKDGIIVQGDKNLLRAVLQNLFDNAWKYTSKHPIARIEFGVTDHAGQSTYYVKDDGAGFDMQYAGKLFGAFQRLHGVEEFPGTGVGLATVARIIHRHGGQIWAQAEVEVGATFYFTLGNVTIDNLGENQVAIKSA